MREQLSQKMTRSPPPLLSSWALFIEERERGLFSFYSINRMRYYKLVSNLYNRVIER
jgi:hypothetical protein